MRPKSERGDEHPHHLLIWDFPSPSPLRRGICHKCFHIFSFSVRFRRAFKLVSTRALGTAQALKTAQHKKMRDDLCLSHNQSLWISSRILPFSHPTAAHPPRFFTKFICKQALGYFRMLFPLFSKQNIHNPCQAMTKEHCNIALKLPRKKKKKKRNSSNFEKKRTVAVLREKNNNDNSYSR